MGMRIGMFGDVVGRAGRDAVAEHMPRVRKELRLDAVVLNIENAASGFGFNGEMVRGFRAAGVDLMTTGNHAFDQADGSRLLSEDKQIIRPLNYPAGTPGQGVMSFVTAKGTLVVAQAMGRLFMNPLDCPFAALDKALALYKLGHNAQALVIDLHGEATSEKMALGHHFDGRASLVTGTHTHAPTADTQILPQGTGYQSDLGMTGDYHSVIGFDPEVPVRRFLTGRSGGRLKPAMGPATLTGLFIEVDEASGLTKKIEPIRVGGSLAETFPQG